MRILVEIAGSEQGCCGRAFAVGERSSWHLIRAEPHNDPLPRFRAEHHGQTPPEVPLGLVTGTVRAIRETGRNRRRTLPPLAHDLAEFDISERDVTAVRERGNEREPGHGGGLMYRVELEVADDATLPGYVADPAVAAAALRRNRERNAVVAAMQDALGGRMRAVLRTEAAQVIRDDNGSVAALEPATTGAAALSWRRGVDDVLIQAGEGRFTVHTSSEFDRIVTAVQSGTIREDVGERTLRTVIETADSPDLVAEEAINAFTGSGFRALDGRTAARIRRGSFRYRPW